MAWVLFHPPDKEVGTEVSPHLSASPSPILSDDYIFYYLSDGQKRQDIGDMSSWTPPIELNTDTEYTWYCEHYNVSDVLQSTSPTWSFTTTVGVGLPGKPTNPSPADDATSIALGKSPFSWDASSPAAETYEIYFRIQGAEWGTPVGESQVEVEWIVTSGLLDYIITYEWRVDATNVVGTVTGDTWTFGSITYDPPLPTGVSLDYSGDPEDEGYGEPTGTPTGANNMITIRKLVVAANSKIWYEDL